MLSSFRSLLKSHLCHDGFQNKTKNNAPPPQKTNTHTKKTKPKNQKPISDYAACALQLVLIK